VRPAALRVRCAAAALSLAATVSFADTVSFRDSVLPLLTERCVVCHVEGAEQGHLRLYPDAWAQLVGVPSTQSPLMRIQPGKPEKSYLYLKLLGTQADAGGNGLRMPLQQDPLSAAELELLRKWIEQGAGQD
jgi:hypothetical protein